MFTAMKRLGFIIVLFFLFISSGFAQNEVLPDLTPAQKEADFIYLTALMRDLYPFAEFNAQYKRHVWLQPALPATDFKKETLLQDPWIQWILSDKINP